MKKWLCAPLILLLAACGNDSAPKSPESLTKDQMPARIQQLYSSIDQKPDSVGLRLKLVDALDSLGAYKQALTQMDSLISKDSLNFGLWYRKATLQQNTTDTSGALQSYRYAIRIYPSPDAMLGAANLLAEKKDSTALMICNTIERQRMGREYNAHCNFISGVYYSRTGNQQKALDFFDNCIMNDLNYLEAYMEKGFILFDQKKYKDALTVFQTVVQLKNTYADGYYWMAKTDEALNNKTEAIINYNKSLELDPSISEATAALKRLGVK
jgi:tetratricopeptide (TPR) repeat protein